MLKTVSTQINKSDSFYFERSKLDFGSSFTANYETKVIHSLRTSFAGYLALCWQISEKTNSVEWPQSNSNLA